MSTQNIDWYEEYETLRTMHSQLKELRNETVGGIPHFAGKPKELPVRYHDLLNAVSEALYAAERYVSRKMY